MKITICRLHRLLQLQGFISGGGYPRCWVSEMHRTTQALDEVTAKAMAPAAKLRSLLQAPDKRKALLDMACASHSPPSLDIVPDDIAHYRYFPACFCVHRFLVVTLCNF